MKLTDKRYLKFEAMMLLCGVSVFCLLCGRLIYCNVEIDSGSGAIFILLFPFYCFTFQYAVSRHGCCTKETLG